MYISIQMDMQCDHEPWLYKALPNGSVFRGRQGLDKRDARYSLSPAAGERARVRGQKVQSKFRLKFKSKLGTGSWVAGISIQMDMNSRHESEDELGAHP